MRIELIVILSAVERLSKTNKQINQSIHKIFWLKTSLLFNVELFKINVELRKLQIPLIQLTLSSDLDMGVDSATSMNEIRTCIVYWWFIIKLESKTAR